MQQRQNESYAQCEEPSIPERTRGNYENKIRFYSPPEKTFEIFANKKSEDGGELRMSYEDFLKAMTPWCHTPFFEGTEQYLKDNEVKMLKLVDVDNDGTISFTEFFFFLVLLQIPEQKLRRMINLKYKETGGKMTRDQASETLREIRKLSGAGKRSQNKAALDARLIKATDEAFMETNKAICAILFKGKELVGIEDILEMRNKFNEDLWHYQFHTFEPVNGKISTENFLKSNT